QPQGQDRVHDQGERREPVLASLDRQPCGRPDRHPGRRGRTRFLVRHHRGHGLRVDRRGPPEPDRLRVRRVYPDAGRRRGGKVGGAPVKRTLIISLLIVLTVGIGAYAQTTKTTTTTTTTTTQKSLAAAIGVFVFPNAGQSSSQQSKDE